MFAYIPGWQETFLWVIIVAFFVAFMLSFGMGANDCANAYGTSVGSKVLKLWHAYILASIFETLGAGMLGYKVTETIRKSVVNLQIYTVHSQETVNHTYELVESCPTLNATTNDYWSNFNSTANYTCTDYTSAHYLLGALGSLGGCASWLTIATLFRLPVSATHSDVGANVGFSLVLKGPNGIHWATIGKIVISWLISPLLAGLIAAVLYMIMKFIILTKANPLEASLTALPFIVLIALSCNIFSVTHGGSKYLHLEDLSWWIVVLISIGISGIIAICIRLFAIKKLRQWVLSNRVTILSIHAQYRYNTVAAVIEKSIMLVQMKFLYQLYHKQLKKVTHWQSYRISNAFK